MKVLAGCEYSGVIRDAFAARGHDAWSCDLEACEGNHRRCDVREILDEGWDLMIACPPCTHLSVSGARWFKGKADEQAHGLGFVLQLAAAPVPRICIENPIGILSTHWRTPDQIIQPWEFGHGEIKATCLWLKGLLPLFPTKLVEGRQAKVHRMGPSWERGRLRSRSYRGIAAAMAEQWGELPLLRATHELST